MTATYFNRRSAVNPHKIPTMTPGQLAYLTFITGTCWGTTLSMWVLLGESYEVIVVHDNDTTEVIEVTDVDWMRNSVYRPWPAEEIEDLAEQ